MAHKLSVLQANFSKGWTFFYQYLTQFIYYGLFPSAFFYAMFLQQPTSPFGQMMLYYIGLGDPEFGGEMGGHPGGY